MVHALAPGATLVILLLPATSLDNTKNAVSAAVASLRLGRAEGGVMSLSAAGQIGGEHCVSRAQADSVHAALQAAASRHVTVVAATGDIGAVAEPCDVYAALTGTGTFTPVKEVNLLASDPLVLGAGGTSLTASHTTGAWQGETAWGLPYGNPGSAFQASGGGFSRLFSRPGYQDGVPGIRASRGVPDVSADASGHADLAMVLSDGGRSMIRDSGGTSASAPIWAALIALADQYAGRHLGFVNPAIYQIARSPRYHQAFHDITTGNNTVQFPPATIAGYRAGTRLGSGHRLGQPRRAGAHPAARADRLTDQVRRSRARRVSTRARCCRYSRSACTSSPGSVPSAASSAASADAGPVGQRLLGGAGPQRDRAHVGQRDPAVDGGRARRSPSRWPAGRTSGSPRAGPAGAAPGPR